MIYSWDVFILSFSGQGWFSDCLVSILPFLLFPSLLLLLHCHNILRVFSLPVLTSSTCYKSFHDILIHIIYDMWVYVYVCVYIYILLLKIYNYLCDLFKKMSYLPLNCKFPEAETMSFFPPLCLQQLAKNHVWNRNLAIHIRWMDGWMREWLAKYREDIRETLRLKCK
jgi:hypothetical protein